jgi:hypothetical protein
LLNWRTGNCTAGSNPALTAKAKTPQRKLRGFFTPEGQETCFRILQV